MSLWLIIPRDPLIFRDGKPFTATPGERAKSLIFPFPSTVAGAVRTLAGTDSATGRFDTSRTTEVKQIIVRGPVLVELNENGQIKDRFFPAPADALLVQKEGLIKRYYLSPLQMPTGALSDLDGLKLVGPTVNIKDKPVSNPPRYWNQKQFETWLENPTDGLVTRDELGIQGPARESRTHVNITPETLTAAPGALFQTSGMEFVQLETEKDELPKLKEARLLALVLETAASLKNGLGFLGGERRVARWQKADTGLPDCPPAIRKKIIEQGHFRLVLATPAFFEAGHLPTWLKKTYDVTIQAVALPRYQTISGWDYEIPRPKPTRRLVPAGSVYFLKFEGEKSAIQNFVDDLWLSPVSDDEQSRRDGFGLALLGVWAGNLRKMEVK